MVQRAGRSLEKFVPGQDLFETAVYFVNASSAKSSLRATSQYEALLRSACRRSVGARMTCTTCHDPHSSPSPGDRVSYFRARCLQCHDASGFNAAVHHREQDDCAGCHMPRRATSDISHEQVTDHDIEARPSAKGRTVKGGTSDEVVSAVDLVPVDGRDVGDRERGLAYAQFAARGDRMSSMRAESLLEKVKFFRQADALVHVNLGLLAQIRGDRTKAQKEYEEALAMDPENAVVSANLAVLDVERGDMAAAEALLIQVTEHDPALTVALLNLAALRCTEKKGADARKLVQLALRYNPDDADAQRFKGTGEYGGVHCRLR
jgi:predicted CXXCH cytochrome family protein